MPGSHATAGRAALPAGGRARNDAQRLAEVRSAWLRADYREFDRLVVDTSWSPESRFAIVALQVRRLLRQRDFAEALKALVAQRRTPADADQRALWRCLHGLVQTRLGKDDLAEIRDVLQDQAISRAIRLEAGLDLAEALWATRRLDDAERVATGLDAKASDGNSYARATQMRAWIENARGSHLVAARWFLESLDILERLDEPDAHLVAAGLHPLANNALNMLDVRLLRKLRETFERLPNTDGLRGRRARMAETFAAGWMLEGDVDRAAASYLSLLAEAEGGAKLSAFAGWIEVMRDGRQEVAARAGVRLGRELVERLDWAGASADDRVALLDFAIAALPLDLGVAKVALSRFEGRRFRPDTHFAYERDPRVDALRAEVHAGIVATDDSVRAVELLSEALEVHTRGGFRLDETRVASTLWQLTHDERWRNRALRAASVAPNWPRLAFIRTKGEGEGRMVPSSPPLPRPDAPNLSPALRRVLQHIWEGKTAREIAEELDRSVNTIKNQSKHLNRIFGVTSRAALVRRAAELGLVG